MEVGTYHFTWSPKYDMDAHMATLFGREAHDLSIKLDPTLDTNPVNNSTIHQINKIQL
jgi:hypothetical protein